MPVNRIVSWSGPGLKENAQNAQRRRNRPGIMLLLIGAHGPLEMQMVWCSCRSNYLGRMMAPRPVPYRYGASSNPVYSERSSRSVAWAPFLPVWNPAPSLNSGLVQERGGPSVATVLAGKSWNGTRPSPQVLCNVHLRKMRLQVLWNEQIPIIGLKVLWNVHLQKKVGGGGPPFRV